MSILTISMPIHKKHQENTHLCPYDHKLEVTKFQIKNPLTYGLQM